MRKSKASFPTTNPEEYQGRKGLSAEEQIYLQLENSTEEEQNKLLDAMVKRFLSRRSGTDSET